MGMVGFSIVKPRWFLCSYHFHLQFITSLVNKVILILWCVNELKYVQYVKLLFSNSDLYKLLFMFRVNIESCNYVITCILTRNKWSERQATKPYGNIIFPKDCSNLVTRSKVCVCVSKNPTKIPYGGKHQKISNEFPKTPYSKKTRNFSWRLFFAIIWRGQKMFGTEALFRHFAILRALGFS